MTVKIENSQITSFPDVVKVLNSLINQGSLYTKESFVLTKNLDTSSCGGSGAQVANAITPARGTIKAFEISPLAAISGCAGDVLHIVVNASNTTDYSETSLLDYTLTGTVSGILANHVFSISPTSSPELSAGTVLTFNISASSSKSLPFSCKLIVDQVVS